MPTRSRPEIAQAAIDSFLDMADHPDRVEVIVRLHDNDALSVAWFTQPARPRVIIGDSENYYASMDHFLNCLAAVSNGHWLWPASDGARMLTQGWDSILDARVPNPRATCMVAIPSVPNAPKWTIPVMSRGLYDVLGRFGVTAHCDCYLDSLAHIFGIKEKVPIKTEELNMPDVAPRDRTKTWAQYRNSDTACQFNIDKIKLGAVLRKHIGSWTTTDAPETP